MPRTKLDIHPPKPPENWRLDLGGVTWTLSELSKQIHRKDDYVLAHVVKPNKLELDSSRGGPVRWSKGHGSPWLFKARDMSYWIDCHWPRIQGGGWD
ncbi:DUF771 domain-containing protein [Lactobacillus rhamnosus]|uniref:DUF771 domain-containing protein n=1 Tax=Lacticaseibacillus rhamnosus TaxID=47715 RepID=A0A7Y7UJX1_LACRH|nr:DUF771 domain-containing protein [Lacticaseibacillus rhamnosus]NVO88915.1 DUF771 domain-containing protein [Lacticaseibacillus rhamnosus]